MDNQPTDNQPTDNQPTDNQVVGTHQAPTLPELLEMWEHTLGWCPNPLQKRQFQRLYTLVLEGNRLLNLTRITEPEEFWEKHIWDSLRGIAPWLPSQEPACLGRPIEHVIDIGTGAGFPGVPVAIACPDWKVTLLDATRKKVTFLDTLALPLGLSHLHTWRDRVERIGHERRHRSAYDLALVRAVGPASVCVEYALPLLQVQGTVVLYRGQWTGEEAIALEGCLEQLGGKLLKVEAFTTPLSQSVRHCLYVQKVTPTPARFPRPVGVALQKPL